MPVFSQVGGELHELGRVAGQALHLVHGRMTTWSGAVSLMSCASLSAAAISGRCLTRVLIFSCEDLRAAGRLQGLDTLTGLPAAVALELERSVKATLRLAGELPVRGREYYSDRVTALVIAGQVATAGRPPGGR
ncbi:hypothetical protein [Streptantibioticus ferralitis]|uniref:Uncharacterized protein n=1 Tax=Streptantibioticus ferralitis TaxID=236510 RepID=A0ABT5YTD4_9ACTN|nr:hypothetical protein [Streptantibioticus ferralitis]MDF2254718.1 hypothetical protein [Streptantibioticus ferralitis]